MAYLLAKLVCSLTLCHNNEEFHKKCHNNKETSMHLLICQFAHFYWMRVLLIFNDHIALQNDPITLLKMIFIGSLQERKGTSMDLLQQDFPWLKWCDQNCCIFKDKSKEFNSYFEHLIYILV